MTEGTASEHQRPRAETRAIVVGSGSGLAVSLGELWQSRTQQDGHKFRTVGFTLPESADARGRAGQNPYLVEEILGDASDPEDAARMVGRAVEVLGGIDVMVLAAAAMPIAPLRDTDAERWRRAFAGCVDTAYFPIRAAEPHLSHGASLVLISSINAQHPVPYVTAYAAAKAAVEGLTRALAVELGHRGVRVNAIAPGLIGVNDPERRAGHPLGHVVTPVEVAEVITLLATPAGGGLNGAVLAVDGGFSIVPASVIARDDLLQRFREG